MSQEQAKIYLDAAAKAQAAANAILPSLSSADAALKSAESARATLQKSLQDATSEADKTQIATAIKNLENTVLNPAKIAYSKALSDFETSKQASNQLLDQAQKLINAPNNSVNTTPLGNLADQDATNYPAPDPYFPNAGASGPANLQSERTIAPLPNATGGQSPSLISTPPPSAAPPPSAGTVPTQIEEYSTVTKSFSGVPQTGVTSQDSYRRELTASELDTRVKKQVSEDPTTQTNQILARAAELRGQGMTPAEAYIQARTEVVRVPTAQQSADEPISSRSVNDTSNIKYTKTPEIEQSSETEIQRVATSSSSTIDPSDPENFRNSTQQNNVTTAHSTSPVVSDEEYIVRQQENTAIRSRLSAISIADVEGVDTTAAQQQIEQDIRSGNTVGETEQARKSANVTAVRISNSKDLRVRISLADSAKYFYNADTKGILQPLAATSGVIFPYTPQITMNYSASYDALEPTHSNYKIYNYKSSAIDSISIIGEFTAQDTQEANYLLAVIHFFKTVTKMFYGQDVNPTRGTPPPLCYLSGYGTYAFDKHPIVISSFSLSYPNDVHYINAGAATMQGQQLTEYSKPTFPEKRGIAERIAGLKRTGVAPGGVSSKQPFITVTNYEGITRVPTKMTITLTALPMITRNEMSNYFSLKNYATGALLKNSRGYGGMW